MVRIFHPFFILAIIIIPFAVVGSGYETEVRTYKILTENPSGFVEVLHLNDDPSKYVDVSDILAGTSGVQMNRSGGVDSFSTVMIRGASSNSVDIFVNGVRINPLYMSSCNLSLLPDELFERIEVYKGFTPVRLGFSNTGGSVNIVTRKGRGKYYGLKFMYGSFNTAESGFFMSESDNESGYLLSLYMRHTDGDFEFINHNGTPDNKDDDVIRNRQNNYRNEYALSLSAGSRLSRYLKVNISVIPYYSSGGIAGPENLETKDASYNSLTNILSLENHIQLRKFLNEVIVGYSNLYFRTEMNDEKGELNMLIADTTDTSGIKNTFYIAPDFLFFRNNLVLKLSYSEEETLRTSRIKKNEKYSGERKEYLFVAEDNFEVIKERLYIIPSFGLKGINDNVVYSSGYLMKENERLGNDDRIRNYRVGLMLRVSDELLFKSNYSDFKRYPDMYELFGDGVYLFPNPELKPERGELFDAGFEFFHERLVLKFAVFNNKYDDLINFWQNSQKTIKSENISMAEIYGTELYLRPLISNYIISEFSYTHQEPVNKSEIPSFKNKILPFRYTDNLYLKCGLSAYGLKLIYEYSYSSQNYFDGANFLPKGGMPERSIHSLNLSYYYRLLDVTLGFYVKNITDVRTMDIAGYPLPGRMFFIGMYKTFRPLEKEVRYETD